jgi:hypothetical protein
MKILISFSLLLLLFSGCKTKQNLNLTTVPVTKVIGNGYSSLSTTFDNINLIQAYSRMDAAGYISQKGGSGISISMVTPVTLNANKTFDVIGSTKTSSNTTYLAYDQSSDSLKTTLAINQIKNNLSIVQARDNKNIETYINLIAAKADGHPNKGLRSSDSTVFQGTASTSDVFDLQGIAYNSNLKIIGYDKGSAYSNTIIDGLVKSSSSNIVNLIFNSYSSARETLVPSNSLATAVQTRNQLFVTPASFYDNVLKKYQTPDLLFNNAPNALSTNTGGLLAVASLGGNKFVATNDIGCAGNKYCVSAPGILQNAIVGNSYSLQLNNSIATLNDKDYAYNNINVLDVQTFSFIDQNILKQTFSNSPTSLDITTLASSVSNGFASLLANNTLISGTLQSDPIWGGVLKSIMDGITTPVASAITKVIEGETNGYNVNLSSILNSPIAYSNTSVSGVSVQSTNIGISLGSIFQLLEDNGVYYDIKKDSMPLLDTLNAIKLAETDANYESLEGFKTILSNVKDFLEITNLTIRAIEVLSRTNISELTDKIGTREIYDIFKIIEDKLTNTNVLSNAESTYLFSPFDIRGIANKYNDILANGKFKTTLVSSSNLPSSNLTPDSTVSSSIVSAAAANIWAIAPDMNGRQVMEIILKSAKPIDDSGATKLSGRERKQGEAPLLADGKSIDFSQIDFSTLSGTDLNCTSGMTCISSKYGFGLIDVDFAIKSILEANINSTLNANLSNTAMMASGVMGGGSGSGSGGYGGGIAGLVNAASKAVFVDAFGYAFDNNLAFKLNFNNGLGGRVNAYSNAVTYNTLSGYTNSYNSFFTSATSAAQGLGGFASTTSFGGYAGLSGYSGYSTTGRGFSANYLDGEFNLNSSSNSSGLGSSSKSSSNSLFASFANFITSFSGSSSFGSGMNFGLDGSYGQNQQSSFGFNLNPASLNSINIGTDLNFNSFANRFTSSDNNIYSLNSNSGLKAFGDSLGAGSGIVGGLAGNGSTSFIKGNANSYSASNASLGLSYFTNTKNSFINPLLYSSALSSTGYGFVSGANNANPLNSNFISSSLANLNLGLGSLGMGLGGSYYNQASLINFNQNPLVRGFAGLGSGSNLSNPFNATNNATQSFNFALGDYSLAYSKNALIQNTSSLASALFQGFSNQSYKLGFKTSTKSALNLSYSNIKPFTQSLGIAEFNNSSNNSNNSNNSANFGARLIEASFTHSPNKKLAYDVKLGFLNETHSFLANLVSGAFSVNGAKTGFVEFLFHYNLTAKTAFDFGTSLGLTKVSTISGLLFDSFTTLFTNSASLRLTKYGVFFNGSSGNSGSSGNGGSSNNYSSGFKTSDSISISLSAPTAITSGSVRIRSMNSLSQASISTTNKTRQLDTGLAYKLSLSSNNSAAYIKGLNSITSHKISSHKPFTAAELSLGITHSQNYHHTPNLSVNTLFIGVGVGG